MLRRYRNREHHEEKQVVTDETRMRNMATVIIKLKKRLLGMVTPKEMHKQVRRDKTALIRQRAKESTSKAAAVDAQRRFKRWAKIRRDREDNLRKKMYKLAKVAKYVQKKQQSLYTNKYLRAQLRNQKRKFARKVARLKHKERKAKHQKRKEKKKGKEAVEEAVDFLSTVPRHRRVHKDYDAPRAVARDIGVSLRNDRNAFNLSRDKTEAEVAGLMVSEETTENAKPWRTAMRTGLKRRI